MPYEEKSRRLDMPHNIIMEGRERLSISGVEDVESFDESAIVMYTTQGVLIIRGSSLHIDRLSLDGGELSVEGMVDSLQYEQEQASRGGFFSRLFR